MRQRFVQGWGGDSHLFLDDKRRQTDRADGLAKPAKALRRDIHLRLRVFAREMGAVWRRPKKRSWRISGGIWRGIRWPNGWGYGERAVGCVARPGGVNTITC
jgi:hypothetical protein